MLTCELVMDLKTLKPFPDARLVNLLRSGHRASIRGVHTVAPTWAHIKQIPGCAATRNLEWMVLDGLTSRSLVDLTATMQSFKALRSLRIHNCEKLGLESQRRGNPRFEAWLRGYAAWIHMVHPDEGSALTARVERLLGDAV